MHGSCAVCVGGDADGVHCAVPAQRFPRDMKPPKDLGAMKPQKDLGAMKLLHNGESHVLLK